MSFTSLTLPSRPLTVSTSAVSAPRGLIFGTLFMVALTVGLLWWQAPGIWRDWLISLDPVTVQQSDVRGGECTTRRAIFTDCHASLAWSLKGELYESDVSFAFVDFHSGDYWVDVVISGRDPTLGTMSLGIEKLWNRILTVGGFAALFLGIAGAQVLGALRARRTRRALAQPGRLEIVPVAISASQTQRGKDYVTYAQRLSGGKTGKNANTIFANGSEPLMTYDAAGALTGVAVLHEGAALPVLLDRKLERIDLTPAERSAALADIAQEEAREGEAAPAKKKKSVIGRILLWLLAILLIAAGLLGFWAWYAVEGDAFNPVGMTINELMPEAMNQWACDRLAERFAASSHPPSGCVGVDFSTWK